MLDRFLEVTFHNGRPIAGYLHLHRRAGDTVARSEKREAGLIVDFAADNHAIGIEITSPNASIREPLARILDQLHVQPLATDELTPLLAA